MNSKQCVCAALVIAGSTAGALEPGDVIVNEIYFNNRGSGAGHHEAVELLVIKDGADLNSLVISDRDFWKFDGEDRCILQDVGSGFLSSVPSGTLVVIYNGSGRDDTDSSDFILRFYAKSSLYCNTAPTTNAFRLNDSGDNIHLIKEEKQLDFVKYRAANRPNQGAGDPGSLEWEGGFDGVVDVGNSGENTGIRFLGNRPDLNDFHATWQSYPDTYLTDNNLGLPNGGRNTEWIQELRKKSAKQKQPETRSDKPEGDK